MSEDKVVFDKELAIERLGGDDELLAELAEVYLDDLDSMMADIQAAVAVSDAEGLARTAHKLKGAASNFSADSFGVFSASVDLGQLPSSLTTWSWKGKLEDQSGNKYEATDSITVNP